MKKAGFNLLELMIVIAIIAFLSMIVVPQVTKMLAKAKRAEAYMVLRSLYLAQKTHSIEHGAFSNKLTGADGIQWKPESSLQYTYGFPGSEGVNYFTGSLKTPAQHLQQAQVSPSSFTIVAAGDIDNDGQVDILTIDQTGTIRIVQDDLA
jgi:prepilin-type N-terminal cleavage/methylation domain-containing protein